MKIEIGDIDIDVVNRDEILEDLPHVKVSRIENGEIKKHNTGIYVQNVSFDPLTMLSEDDYKSEKYTKIDLIHFNVLSRFYSNDQIYKLLEIEPNWDLLKDREFVENCIHIHKWYDLIKKMNIDSVDKLAMFLGIIRPGKEYLRNETWPNIEKNVWTEEKDGYFFKKSHAYGYALTIVLYMNGCFY